ncbi:MAG TPA: spermidine synthase [Firmicutes bacterium]|jgi:spermidine synthase|nr:spermidine synthase [Bacillota bacterium]
MNSLPSVQVIERVEGKDGELVLRRRGREYEFIFNGVFLMASYNGASEKEMVSSALNNYLANLPSGDDGGASGVSGLRVLMGGLGMGLGLREALNFPGVARVDLFELEETVVRWNRGPLVHLNGGALDDARVNVIIGDIAASIRGEGATPAGDLRQYHAIILDTDNGPGWLSRPENEFLYSMEGTRQLKRLLHSGGCLSVWSSMPVQSYISLLKSLFADVRTRQLQERTGQSSFYYLAVKRDST